MKKKNTALRMCTYLKPYTGIVVLCVLLNLGITGLELWKPILIGNALDNYVTGDAAAALSETVRFHGILVESAKYLGLMVALFLCERYQYLLMQNTAQNVIYEMRQQIFAHVEKLTMRFFDLTPIGTVVTRITNDVEAVNQLYSQILVRLFRNAMKVIGLIVVMLTINVRMALYSFALLPLVTFLTILFRKIAHSTYRIVKNRITDLNTFLSENISGMRIIQIFAREGMKFGQFEERSKKLYDAYYREMMVFAIFRPSLYLTSIAALIVVLLAGSRGVLAGGLTIGTLYIFIQYINSFFEPIQDLAEQFSTLQSAVASAEKIFTLLDTEPLLEEPEHPKTPELKGKIEFDHVWFAYDNENYVLKDVSFTIEPGQRAAFVGATGAGKSSILNLIGRYYDIQKGEIRIDGVNVKDIPRETLRSWIGQVQQDVFIFTGDVGSNIALRDEIPEEQLEKAAHEVNADRFIDTLPHRYREPVSERGSTFSAGQRQLLSFARTLAHNPAILILDEATANIDTETEQWIQDALETLMKGRTTIMVAHRLSTIQHADQIFVMAHGRIREHGTHQELLAQDGIYSMLYQLQLT